METLKQIIEDMDAAKLSLDEESLNPTYGSSTKGAAKAMSELLSLYLPRLKSLLKEQLEASTEPARTLANTVLGEVPQETQPVVETSESGFSEAAGVGQNEQTKKVCMCRNAKPYQDIHGDWKCTICDGY